MNIDAIPTGKNPPDELNVIIEVPLGGEPIKYEIDKDSGALFVDRFLYTPMRYPGNYGFVPHTLCGDGDPLDVIVMNSRPLVPGAVVRSRPVGVLFMEDDGGQDEKIIAVPVSKLTRMYDGIQDIGDMPEIQLERVKHFFTHYKDLEPGKWARIDRIGGMARAGQRSRRRGLVERDGLLRAFRAMGRMVHGGMVGRALVHAAMTHLLLVHPRMVHRRMVHCVMRRMLLRCRLLDRHGVAGMVLCMDRQGGGEGEQGERYPHAFSPSSGRTVTTCIIPACMW